MKEVITNIQQLKASALKREYSLKLKANESYSMRAFARDLGVSHTLLVLIFSGKRKITDSFSKKILSNDKLSSSTKEIFSLGLKSDSLSEEENYYRLSLAQTQVMSNWVHYAILSLLEVEGFKWDKCWIANRLGISKPKAHEAMARIEELGMVEKTEAGRYRQKVKKIIVENKNVLEAGKKFNRGLLKKAIDSMESCQFKHRDLSSTIFKIDPQYIPFATERIRAFRRELTDQLELMGAQSEVYALSVQLFPLSHMEKQA